MSDKRNMILLGAYISYTSILSKEVVLEALPMFMKRKKLIPLNTKAIEKGMAYVKIGAKEDGISAPK